MGKRGEKREREGGGKARREVGWKEEEIRMTGVEKKKEMKEERGV